MASKRSRSPAAEPIRLALPGVALVLLGLLVVEARSYTASATVFAGTLVVPAVSIAVLAVLGYYIASRRPSVGEMRTVLRWSLLGLGVMVVVVAWYQLLDSLHDHAIPLDLIGLATLSIGGGMGAVVGWYSARARANAEAAAEARAHRDFLERRRETMALVDRTLRHNLTNGLSVVAAHVDLLDEHVTEAGEVHRRTVAEQTAEMIETIDELRTVSEALFEEGETEPVDLAAVIRDEIGTVERAYPEADVERGDVPDRLPVAGNRLLGEAVSNLLNNAVQHNDSSTPRVRVEATDDGAVATVRVSDDGPGIPADRRETVFEMGERGRESTGSGMGLFLARTVLERLGGRVWIEDDGPGTTVAFEVPVAGRSP